MDSTQAQRDRSVEEEADLTRQHHEELAALVGTVQGVIVAIGRAPVAECVGDSEGYFSLPRQADGSPGWLSTTVALSVILLRGLGWSTSRGPPVGYSTAFLGSQKGTWRLLNRLLDLSAAAVLRPGCRCIHSSLP
jgi:hypothetical protein